ncbi:MAG TPA: TonB-dependent receptor [Candidatus Acidoferrales bacterium]|nr:TonB-dependent receptor [Candidatus Acidoferrales bacterium]
MQKISTASLIFFLSLKVFAGDTGKIAGRVVDGSSKEPLVGATVMVVGTSFGAATDLDGRYVILNVQPGVYTVRASAVGYQPVESKNNNVSIDLTTEVDFELNESAVTTEPVVVTAQKPLVQKDMTASTAVVSSSQIEAMPVTSMQDVLNLQAGIYVDRDLHLHARGGRWGEVTYMIDGVPVTDSYDGSTVVDVNKNSIQEMQLVTGAFNAEYGQAMSGIVNIATKTGGDEFKGSITAYGGSYATSHSDIFAGLQKIDPLSIRWLEGSLDGPIVSDKLFFYADARYYYTAGDLMGIRKFNTYDRTNAIAASPSDWIIRATGNGQVVPLAPYLEGYGQGKLTYKVTPEFQLSYNFILDNARGKDFDWSYKYNPDGELSNFKKGYLNTLNLTHTLNPSTFYTLGLSYYFRDYREYLDESPFSISDLFARQDPFNQQYVHTALLQAPEGTFLTGGTNMAHNIHSTNTYVAKFDITSQVSDEHMIKAGLEFDQYQLFLHNINLQMQGKDIERNPITDADTNAFLESPIFIPGTESPNNLMYLHKPQQFSAYLQDKMEYKSLIVNLGVRLDWFHPDGQILASPADPNVYAPVEPQYQDSVIAPVGSRINGVTVTSTNQHDLAVQQRMKFWYRNASDKYQLSPRLGVSFPITDRGIVHFSYGLFFQMPSFDELYQSPGYKLQLAGNSNLGVIGNPDLQPEETTSGELGLQQQLTDDISIDITGFFRDIRNLAGTLNEIEYVAGGSYEYSKFVNTDFGFVKGIVISVDKRFSNSISATVDYTFQIAKGDASDPNAAFNLRNSGVQPETQLIPLDWDQQHTLNASLNYDNADDWGASFIFRYGSGTPYTPQGLSNVGELVYNSGLKPSTYNLDARLYKNFKLGTTLLSIFLSVNNVLDTKNAVNVYNDTGLPDVSLAEESLLQSNPSQRVATVQDWYTNPSFYSEPRRVEFGTTISF